MTLEEAAQTGILAEAIADYVKPLEHRIGVLENVLHLDTQLFAQGRPQARAAKAGNGAQ